MQDEKTRGAHATEVDPANRNYTLMGFSKTVMPVPEILTSDAGIEIFFFLIVRRNLSIYSKIFFS